MGKDIYKKTQTWVLNNKELILLNIDYAITMHNYAIRIELKEYKQKHGFA